ncbi:MAG: hypothetical protein IJ017_03940 [Oscillospiraceae bacterium]|nr:hypothetical protein [Oscillospiraceae bacterium]
MGRKLLSSFLAVMLLLSCTGCASILEGEVTEITPYSQSGDTSMPDSAIEVSTYDSFRQEVYNMVKSHTETATFRITTFDREDLEGSVNEICRELSSSDPLGSYATYYISCQITPIVGYKDVTVNIVFKKDLSDISNISTVSTERYLQVLLESSLTDYASSCTFYTNLPPVTADYIKEIVLEQYYSNPLNVIIVPDITVTSYPEAEGNRIMEVSFVFNNYTRSVLTSMDNDLSDEIQNIISELPDADDYQLLSAVYNHMAGSYLYLTNAATKLASTAYNVIVNRSGDSEGFAMAFKALCDKLLIDCTVVSGKYRGEEHYWNIVTIDGGSYHIDVTTLPAEEITTFLRGDESMRENYWWDSSTVPLCAADYIVAETETPVTETETDIPADEEQP